MDTFISDLATKILSMNLMRYFFFSGTAFLIFYVLLKNKWGYAKIQNRFPKSSDYQREILYSIVTCFIFVGVGLAIFATPLEHYTLRYESIATYGWAYWFLSIILMIFLHDTYFYWTHRAMHHPALFKYFHLVHHKSVNPSPWASYAFHPLEGIIEAGVIIPIAFLIPFHATAIMAFLFFMMAYNVYGHLGYELYPKGFNKHFIGKWLNTSINHNLHHKHFNGNYGLYFLFWDRWMGTVRADYDQTYQAVDEKRTQSATTSVPDLSKV